MLCASPAMRLLFRAFLAVFVDVQAQVLPYAGLYSLLSFSGAFHFWFSPPGRSVLLFRQDDSEVWILSK